MSRPSPSRGLALLEDRRSASFVVLALCAYTFLVYSPTLFFEFTYDDFIFFQPADPGQDVRVKDPAIADPSLIFSEGRWLERSIRSLTLALDHAIWGTNPVGYHLTNLLLHLAVVVSVFIFSRDAFGSVALAGLVALFFAVHPVHTEVVANVSYRKDSLACLLGLWCLLCFRRKAKPWCWVLSLILLGLAFLAKEVVGLCTLAALLVTDAMLRERASTERRRWWPTVTYFSALLVLSTVYVLWSGSVGYWWNHLRSFSESEASLTFGDVVVRSICAFGYNLRLLYLPWGYAPEHFPAWGFTIGGETHLSAPFARPDFYLGLFHIVLLPVLVVRLRRYTAVSWGVAFFLSTYLALTGAIVFMKRLIAERYLYFPSLGFCLVLGVLVWSLRRSRSAFLFALIGITAVYSASTVVHSLAWRDNFHLWKPLATSSGPRDSYAVLNFTHACGLTGRHEEGVKAATRFLAQTRGKAVTNPDFYKNLAGCLRGTGSLDRSTRVLEAALRYFPGDAGLQFSLGFNAEEFARRGERKSSSEAIAKLLALGDAVGVEIRSRALARLGLNARDEGDLQLAKSHLTRALQLHATADAHVWLGQVQLALREFDDARLNAERALDLDAESLAATDLLRLIDEREE